ncbi:MAG: ParB-like protein [Steroidobacteraceae bacterium]|jgi:hypothetical protein
MPKIQESSIAKLMPTQITVGLIEVADKVKEIRALKPGEVVEFMRAHAAPAVTGSQCAVYITDHHHVARAALEAGVETGFFEIEADMSRYEPDDFWKEMDKNLWVHPLDENGVRHYYAAVPHRLQDLADDVYRSLAGYARNAGGFEKTPTAFAEFIWADYFRRSVPVELVRSDFAAAVQLAIPLARSPLAMGIPGFKG